MLIDYLLHEPDAVALVLLVLGVGLTLVVGLVAGSRRDRRDGSAATAEEPGEQERQVVVTTWPHLLRLELVASLATLLFVTWWAIGLEVPLGSVADPGVTPKVAKAPWFFVGIQEMLQYFDAWLAGAVLPLLMLAGLCALPYIDHDTTESGRYTLRRRPVALAVTLALVVLWVLPMVVGLLLRGENWSLQPVWEPQEIDVPPVHEPLLSLATLIDLRGAGQHLLGGGLVLGPFFALVLSWPRARRRPWAARLGPGRYLVAGSLLLLTVGVVLKVVLHMTLDIRYLWVTPWFRI
jgi:hypothetical protein